MRLIFEQNKPRRSNKIKGFEIQNHIIGSDNIMYEGILTTGITELNRYPPKICTNYCKQAMETDLLTIPFEKPVIESINEVMVDICIENSHIINTVLGPKLILNCVKNIKVVYTANNAEQSLHSSYWKIPFCNFILLNDTPYDDCLSLIKNVFIGIEAICINDCSDKLINISVLFIICPIIKKESCLNNHSDIKKQNYSLCSQYRKYSPSCIDLVPSVHLAISILILSYLWHISSHE